MIMGTFHRLFQTVPICHPSLNFGLKVDVPNYQHFIQKFGIIVCRKMYIRDLDSGLCTVTRHLVFWGVRLKFFPWCRIQRHLVILVMFGIFMHFGLKIPWKIRKKYYLIKNVIAGCMWVSLVKRSVVASSYCLELIRKNVTKLFQKL